MPDFNPIDLERKIAEEHRAQILGVTIEETSDTVELSSPIGWLLNDSALFHYTTPDGLIGILTEKKIRATSLWHMNDASELTYARNLYLEVLFEFSRDRMNEHEMILAALYTVEAVLLDQYTLFAACFCRDGDLLSQWQTYGATVGGFAIGMDLSHSLDGIDGWTQLQVIYDARQQREYLWQFFARAVETLSQDPIPKPDEPWPMLAAFQKEAVFLMASLKHPAFEAEREVRLVQWWHKSFLAHIKWRSAESMIIPYIELALSANEAPHFGRPPVVDLVIGPTNDAALATKSIDLLLEEFGYTFRQSKSVRVRMANAPLRTR